MPNVLHFCKTATVSVIKALSHTNLFQDKKHNLVFKGLHFINIFFLVKIYSWFNTFKFIDILIIDIVTAVSFAHDDKYRLACSSIDGTLSVCQLMPLPPSVQCRLRGHKEAVVGKLHSKTVYCITGRMKIQWMQGPSPAPLAKRNDGIWGWEWAWIKQDKSNTTLVHSWCLVFTQMSYSSRTNNLSV